MAATGLHLTASAEKHLGVANELRRSLSRTAELAAAYREHRARFDQRIVASIDEIPDTHFRNVCHSMLSEHGEDHPFFQATARGQAWLAGERAQAKQGVLRGRIRESVSGATLSELSSSAVADVLSTSRRFEVTLPDDAVVGGSDGEVNLGKSFDIEYDGQDRKESRLYQRQVDGSSTLIDPASSVSDRALVLLLHNRVKSLLSGTSA